MSDEFEALKKKIQTLEHELDLREQDVAFYQKELVGVNKKLQSLLDTLGDNLSFVEEVYKLLVPTKIPEIPGFEFSSKFLSSSGSGGNYFDIFQHVDKASFGIVLSSASSYVMSGLILSSLLKLNDKMIQGAMPIEIVRSIVEGCSKKINQFGSSSLFYSLFDRRTYKLKYYLVGNICALLYDYESGQVKLLKSSSESFKEEFLQTSSNLNGEQSLFVGPRDRLILCSPGVFIAKNTNGESFGKERLFQVVVDSMQKDVHQLRNNILHTVDNFMCELQSDITVVVAEVSDKIIKLA